MRHEMDGGRELQRQQHQKQRQLQRQQQRQEQPPPARDLPEKQHQSRHNPISEAFPFQAKSCQQ